ncbi:hypothetical protein FALCPG4_016924 [Fusarium falciforme]
MPAHLGKSVQIPEKTFRNLMCVGPKVSGICDLCELNLYPLFPRLHHVVIGCQGERNISPLLFAFDAVPEIGAVIVVDDPSRVDGKLFIQARYGYFNMTTIADPW